MTLDILSPSGWLSSDNGQILYAYAGTKTAGGVTETMINIPSVGLDDLMVNMSMTADWQAVAQTLGVSVSIDDIDIIFQNNNPSPGLCLEPPWHFVFPVPAQTQLKVVSHCDAGSTGAFRGVYVWASKLKVQ